MTASDATPEELAELASTRPLVLLGSRGVGKTTVGRRLGALLARPFVDLDERVLLDARRAGEPAGDVAALYVVAGPARFRELEGEALRRALRADDRCVLATGGGVVERADSRAKLRRRGLCVWLREELAVLRARVRADGDLRPPVEPGGDAVAELERLLARRTPWYASLAHLVVEGRGRGADELAKEIASRCGIRPPN